MKTEDFNKTKDELQEAIKRNNQLIAVSDERTRMARVNQFENKFGTTLGFSMAPYLGIFVLFAILTSNGTMTSITNTIPVESLPLIITGSSLGIGTIGRKIIEWKFKTKERFKSFTTAKTQYEKIQEEIKYAVELEKANNRNKAIQETLNSLSSNQSILNSLSNRYDISDKNVPQTIEESKKIVDELSMILNDKYNELDVLTTQKVLHEKFWKVRTKGQSSTDIMIAAMMGGMLSMLYVDMPFIFMQMSETLTNFSFSSSLMGVFAPLVAGMAGISGYMIKRNKDYIRVFNNLNNDLNENALPEKIKEAREEQQDIDAKIESKIREISIAEAQLQEQKRIMESFADNSEGKKKKLETSVSKEHTIEETRNDTIFEYTKESLTAFMDEDIFAGAEILPQIEEKGPSLTLKRKPYNSSDRK